MMIRKILKRTRDLFLIKVIWRKYKIHLSFRPAKGVHLWAKNKIEIGKHVYFGRYTHIETDVVIKNHVLIANNVAFVGRNDHNFQEIGSPIIFADYIRNKNYSWRQKNSLTIVENDVWIGYGAIILSGITIGVGSIIAAGSIVTKDVEPYSICAGNPAKKIRNRFNTEEELARHIELYNMKYK
jgi:acetyltransferase-like isoleucine patch superfamily enzyme